MVYAHVNRFWGAVPTYESPEPGRVREFKELWLWLEGFASKVWYTIGVRHPPKGGGWGSYTALKGHPKYSTFWFSGIKKPFLDKVIVPHLNEIVGIKWRYTFTKGRLWVYVPLSIEETEAMTRWISVRWYDNWRGTNM